MDKNTAKICDALLAEIAKLPKSGWHISHITATAQKVGFTSQEQIDTAISLFQKDGFIEFIKHPNALEHNFDIYGITNLGITFINFEGGYREKSLYQNYNKTNVKFTWIRHWVWFYTAVASLLANLYFICKYLLLLL